MVTLASVLRVRVIDHACKSAAGRSNDAQMSGFARKRYLSRVLCGADHRQLVDRFRCCWPLVSTRLLAILTLVITVRLR